MPCLCVLRVLCGENLFAIRNLNGANRDERHGRWAGIATREERCSGRALRAQTRYKSDIKDQPRIVNRAVTQPLAARPGLSIVNRAEGIDEIEGKAGRVAASEAGAERVSIDSSDGMT